MPGTLYTPEIVAKISEAVRRHDAEVERMIGPVEGEVRHDWRH